MGVLHQLQLQLQLHHAKNLIGSSGTSGYPTFTITQSGVPSHHNLCGLSSFLFRLTRNVSHETCTELLSKLISALFPQDPEALVERPNTTARTTRT